MSMDDYSYYDGGGDLGIYDGGGGGSPQNDGGGEWGGAGAIDDGSFDSKWQNTNMPDYQSWFGSESGEGDQGLWGNINMPGAGAGYGGQEPAGQNYEAENAAAIQRMIAEIDAYNASKKPVTGQSFGLPMGDPTIKNNAGGKGSGGSRRGGVVSTAPTFERPAAFTPKPMGPAETYTPESYKPGQFNYSGPEFKLPEYALPEEDKNYELRKREEFAASSRRMLGKKANEALLTTRNLDNPNARAKMLQSVVAGYGEGMEGVMREAGGAASRSAAMKRQEKIHEYAANWSARAEEARTTYQRGFETQLRNFMMGEQAAQANVAARNQAGLFNLQNRQAIAERNWAAENQAAMANWQLDAQMYAKSPKVAGQATPYSSGYISPYSFKM